MKKSYQKIIIFDTILIIVLLLNSFILNILGNYYYMDIFLILLLIVFKILFGFEKDRHRYIKDIITNIIITLLISFIIYYIIGIFIGFYKPTNYLTLYGFKTFIIPFIIMIIAREYFRCQMLNKVDTSKVLTVITCILFIFLELSPRLNNIKLGSGHNVFIFIALTILPVISDNIACTYIARKVGPKVNIFWLLVTNLYTVFLPIVPETGTYVSCLIHFLFPFILIYNVYAFFQKREKNIPISYIKKRRYVEMYLAAAIVFTLAYFVSGLFRYCAVAIATGSMRPNIQVGDVAIVDQHINYKDLKVGDVIAYKHSGVVVVHRLCNTSKIEDEYFFYTKGDNNDAKDNYVIYSKEIIGKVNIKVPYIGLPTIWLNELYN